MAFDYDLFVIGGGSGGVRAARKAAETGARVAIAEEYRFGGTCVIRGCVPKKLFVYASHFSEYFEDAAGFGWSVGETSFDWPTLVANKDREIDRLEQAYRNNLGKAGVETVESRAVIAGDHTVRIEKTGKTVTAERILIATGSRPNPHPALPGHEHCIFSNEAFHLEKLPGKILIAGAGYIAIEFAGIFNGLGVDTAIVYRGMEILSRFDQDLRRGLHEQYEKNGIRIICHNVFENIERLPDGRLRASLSGGGVEEADQIMLAVGRMPNVEGLGLETVGVETAPTGAIRVDDYLKTNVDHIWALGDVIDRMQLTPVAFHEAMCFVET
ncbi:MAG TPA: FAD-dependent oxidoreductase, partial [Afifellaceae bacterium]|nr:FAD-dependent oxidoreductase [Afifellaceae bacterium]